MHYPGLRIILFCLALCSLAVPVCASAAGRTPDVVVVPVIDGSGALGEATGRGGSMNGSLYVPERQATNPRAQQARPARRFHRRFNGYRQRAYRNHRRYPRRLDRRGRVYGPYRSRHPDHLRGSNANPDRRQLERRFGH